MTSFNQNNEWGHARRIASPKQWLRRAYIILIEKYESILLCNISIENKLFVHEKFVIISE